MECNKRVNASALALGCLMLAACAAKSPAEKHASHYIYQISNENDSQIRTLVHDSIKASTPTFDQFYQQGKCDRNAHLSLAEAKTKADYLSSEQFKSKLELNNIVLNKTYKIDSNQKIYTAFMKEATGAYWDGYNGL
ncbi:entry exclusion protein 2 [Serratia sp. AS12]|uniref:Exc2 family lipoprotein n=1 Tax=Serratia TaxID=613 RepID=UPI00020E9B60|nr:MULTISPECIES: Exc2 family lipoprotein [Serratia]AEF45455.1 entry exclusion protein 2 [Serratia plymuthica AS9]AEF50406.1 entry exclusion protein 2 [Serratia sp. AS12]AEG28113.1 entry exclusion protein 2 [Serratia sp. AS13]MBJ7890677.1 Exc2 family lipoprotein [Serratia sp. PAMC26656]UTN98924.1 Exc2 family lipoprotein [Serratia plymuthica]